MIIPPQEKSRAFYHSTESLYPLNKIKNIQKRIAAQGQTTLEHKTYLCQGNSPFAPLRTQQRWPGAEGRAKFPRWIDCPMWEAVWVGVRVDRMILSPSPDRNYMGIVIHTEVSVCWGSDGVFCLGVAIVFSFFFWCFCLADFGFWG